MTREQAEIKALRQLIRQLSGKVLPKKVTYNDSSEKMELLRMADLNDRERLKGKRKSNPRLVKIYDKITRIEGQKGSNSNFPGEKFYHNFSKPFPAMYGTPDRKMLIIKKG